MLTRCKNRTYVCMYVCMYVCLYSSGKKQEGVRSVVRQKAWPDFDRIVRLCMVSTSAYYSNPCREQHELRIRIPNRRRRFRSTPYCNNQRRLLQQRWITIQ